MKRISLYILLSILSISTTIAQVDRTKYPSPGPTPSIHIGEPETFTLPNGLKVFVVENHKLPRVTFSLILDTDPVLEGDKAGFVDMVGELMRSGTKNLSKDQLDEAIDQIGGRIDIGSKSASASSLTKYQDTLLTLFSDILFNPVFPKEELEKIKKQTISALAADKDDPNSISTIVTNAVVYGKNHPYGETATEKTVKRIEVTDIQSYYTTYFKPNVAYLAIVGDITKKEAERLVKKYFSNWKKGDVPVHQWEAAKAPEKTQVILVDRPASVQSVINIAYPIDLPYNSPDRIPASLLSYVLGGGASSRLFTNLREDKGYTYGAYASINPDKISGEFSADASVRTEVTDSAVYQFFHELKRMNEKTITDEEVKDGKAFLMGSFGRSLEKPSTIASFAVNTEIQKLPKDYYINYLKNLDAVSADQLNAMAPTYIKPKQAYVVVVGNIGEFGDKLTQYGEVKNYTAEGELEQKAAAVKENVTAESVIARYLLELGGTEKLTSIKTLKQVAEGEVQGMKISQVIVVDKAKGKAIQRLLMGGQELTKVTITADKVMATTMGKEQALPSEASEALKSVLEIIPELNYADNATITLNGIAKVNGEDAYKINVEKSGVKSTEFFSVVTGLKVQSVSGAIGEIGYSNYRDYNGVKFPTEVTIMNPKLPVKLNLVVTENEINPVLAASDWQ